MPRGVLGHGERGRGEVFHNRPPGYEVEKLSSLIREGGNPTYRTDRDDMKKWPDRSSFHKRRSRWEKAADVEELPWAYGRVQVAHVKPYVTEALFGEERLRQFGDDFYYGIPGKTRVLHWKMRDYRHDDPVVVDRDLPLARELRERGLMEVHPWDRWEYRGQFREGVDPRRLWEDPRVVDEVPRRGPVEERSLMTQPLKVLSREELRDVQEYAAKREPGPMQVQGRGLSWEDDKRFRREAGRDVSETVWDPGIEGDVLESWPMTEGAWDGKESAADSAPDDEYWADQEIERQRLLRVYESIMKERGL